MTRIKVCGVTLLDDAARVAAAGVDFIGLNFWPKSKRYIAPERAQVIGSIVRSTGSAKLVGVFVNPELDDVRTIMMRVDLDVIQLHGDESPDLVSRISLGLFRPVWKAVPIATASDIERLDRWSAEAVLLDAPTAGRGGAGASFDWNLARQARVRFPQLAIVLAGGLTPDNVASAIETVEPWAVDVASGVEAAPGVKDAAKIDAFIGAVRLAG